MSKKKETDSYFYPPRSTIGPENAGLKWLAVDLDGTLAKPIWPDPGVGKPITSAVKKIREAVKAGWKIIINTSRPWDHYEMIEKWLIKNEIPFDRILCGKVLAAAYIDDRNINIRSKTWIPRIPKV